MSSKLPGHSAFLTSDLGSRGKGWEPPHANWPYSSFPLTWELALCNFVFQGAHYHSQNTLCHDGPELACLLTLEPGLSGA